ncbi:hypothetical protein NtRootA9_22690 [Arthrobacter sp. NtRootA9]|nr:hypothetical protein NtRootA9_22690 [Arthrobacter sp. NtRootA9]
MKVPSGFLTSIFSAPGRVPASGWTDWATQSWGRSKLTVLAGSENVFQVAAVAAGDAAAGGEPDAGAPLEGTAPAVPPAGAEVDGPAWAVHPAPPDCGLLQPARSTAATASGAAIRPRALPFPTPAAHACLSMQPA